MKKKLQLILVFYFLINVLNFSNSNENFFDEGLKLFNKKKYEDAKFFFERGIVFNPKDYNSYLYLAKIYNIEDNQKKRKKIWKLHC